MSATAQRQDPLRVALNLKPPSLARLGAERLSGAAGSLSCSLVTPAARLSLTGRDYNETYFLGRRQLRASCVDETTTALESEPLTCAEQVARTSQGLDWDVRQGTPVCSVR